MSQTTVAPAGAVSALDQAVIGQSLLAAAREMGAKLYRSAYSTIVREAKEDPTRAQNAPYSTPVRRLDEAGAAKRPVIRQAL